MKYMCQRQLSRKLLRNPNANTHSQSFVAHRQKENCSLAINSLLVPTSDFPSPSAFEGGVR